jgi:transposase
VTSPLPNDPAELRALLLAERQAHAATRDRLKATELERDAARVRLRALLKRYFGRSSEKLDENQLKMAWAAVEADLEGRTPPRPAKPPRAPRAPSQRRARRLEDLPVLETLVIDLPTEQKLAPDGSALVKIRDEVTEEVDYQPGKLFRRQIIRPVYASPAKVCEPQIAELPPRVVPGGQVGPGLLAHVLMSKYVDAIPLYRQEQMLGRLGPAFSRQAMGEWVEHGAILLRPVHHELQALITRSGYVIGDETPIRVLDPARPGAAREAWLWAFLAPGPQAVVFDFHLVRSHEPALAFLRDFQGVFQTDGYGAYLKALRVLPGEVRPGIVHVNCMAHCRRKFVEALDAGDDRAAPFLAQIGALYAIEEELRQAEPLARAAARSSRSLAWLLPMELALKRAAADTTILPQSALRTAVHYALERWEPLTRFAQPGYGHVHIDSNAVERAIRPSAVGKKNFLFIGHPDAGWRSAVIYSVLGTCALLKINPWDYLNWALPRLAAATNKNAHQFTPHHFIELRS